MQRDESYCWLTILLALLFVTPLASWAREAEELLDGINRLPPKRLCRNNGNAMFVILNPSLPVILSKAKDLIPLRVDSVKNLIKSTS